MGVMSLWTGWWRRFADNVLIVKVNLAVIRCVVSVCFEKLRVFESFCVFGFAPCFLWDLRRVANQV